ncbi:MAG TPA: hypothetical protein ENK18_21650 [Deltaproteobacteria bacterium]|nr:hypothetical protein [Deltaproteobacteria bacterium]
MTSSLRWTRWGAVSAPETLQVRIGALFPGRVVVDAPRASRPMTSEEVVANLDFFRDPGPRERPIRALILSGIPDAWLGGAQLEGVVLYAVGAGLERIVLHLTPGQTAQPLPLGVSVAVVVRTPGDARALQGEALAVTVPLLPGALGELGAVLAALATAPVSQLTLLWPLPAEGVHAPAAGEVIAALLALDDPCTPRWGIKGLPRCVLQPLAERIPDLSDRVWRSVNRFYVDADHQRRAALLFQPDLVSFAKGDACRFCALDQRCDGVAAPWLEAGLVGPLEPVRGGR